MRRIVTKPALIYPGWLWVSQQRLFRRGKRRVWSTVVHVNGVPKGTLRWTLG